MSKRGDHFQTGSLNENLHEIGTDDGVCVLNFDTPKKSGSQKYKFSQMTTFIIVRIMELE
jgi:hypothetical protein